MPLFYFFAKFSEEIFRSTEWNEHQAKKRDRSPRFSLKLFIPVVGHIESFIFACTKIFSLIITITNKITLIPYLGGVGSRCKISTCHISEYKIVETFA